MLINGFTQSVLSMRLQYSRAIIFKVYMHSKQFFSCKFGKRGGSDKYCAVHATIYIFHLPSFSLHDAAAAASWSIRWTFCMKNFLQNEYIQFFCIIFCFTWCISILLPFIITINESTLCCRISNTHERKFQCEFFLLVLGILLFIQILITICASYCSAIDS